MRLSRILSQQGVLIPQVLAALRPKRQLINKQSIIVTAELPPVQQLPAAEMHGLEFHRKIPFSPTLAIRIGEEIAQLHASGFFHGDMKSRHVLVGAENQLFFVDLEKSSHHPNCPRLVQDALSARDLIQLQASLPPDKETQKTYSALLDSYWSTRSLGPKRKQRIRGWIVTRQCPPPFAADSHEMIFFNSQIDNVSRGFNVSERY